MPYASNGQVRQDPADGFIEITDEQYIEAINGMCEGLVVTIDSGFKVVHPVEITPEPHPEPTLDELKALALAHRDNLLAVAAVRIAPLQDAVDLGESSPAEEASLVAWKRYRITLNRIEQQDGFPQAIEWPIEPGKG